MKLLKQLAAAAAITFSAGTAVAGPILVYNDFKDPTPILDHFTLNNWQVERVDWQAVFTGTGIRAGQASDAATFTPTNEGPGRVFVTYSPSGEPSSIDYYGASALNSDALREVMVSFIDVVGGPNSFTSGMVGDLQTARIVLAGMPRVIADPANPGQPGDGVFPSPSTIGSGNPVPEPGTLALLGLGFMGIFLRRRAA